MKYSKDGRVRFDPDKHIYWLGDRKLKGVTTYISEFKEKFDSVKVAEKYVKKHGGTVEDTIKKWAETAVAGTAVHNVFENYIISGEIITTTYPKEQVAAKFIHEVFIAGRLTPIEAEMIVYDEALGLASQVDCIAKNNKGEYFILDWKTNKAIGYNGYGKTMFKPYQNFPDCNFYHYSLQLNIYKRLVKEYPISGLYIVHIDKFDYDIIPAAKINNPLCEDRYVAI